MSHAPIFWFTGLSGSGKSTLCDALKPLLEDEGLAVTILDGDDIRQNHERALGFSKADITTNNHLIANLCQTKRKETDVILVPVIAPFEDVREQVKLKLAPDLYFIYLAADLKSVMQRDVKGLYAKAKAGEIKNMIGYCADTPYEPPLQPDLTLDSSKDGLPQRDCEQRALNFIRDKIRIK